MKNTLLLLRSLPGAGKTTLAQILIENIYGRNVSDIYL